MHYTLMFYTVGKCLQVWVDQVKAITRFKWPRPPASWPPGMMTSGFPWLLTTPHDSWWYDPWSGMLLNWKKIHEHVWVMVLWVLISVTQRVVYKMYGKGKALMCQKRYFHFASCFQICWIFLHLSEIMSKLVHNSKTFEKFLLWLYSYKVAWVCIWIVSPCHEEPLLVNYCHTCMAP